MLPIHFDQLIKPGSLEAELMTSSKEIGPAWTIERNQRSDHGFPCDRLTPGGIINGIFVRSVNHSGLAVKFVRSNITKNPLIRLESGNEPKT